MLNKISSIYRVFKSEFVSQFTVVKLLALLFAIVLPLITILATENYDTFFKNDWSWRNKKDALSTEDYNKAVNLQKIILSNALITAILIQGTIYGLIVRFGSILRDNSTIDKNRVSFLYYNKNLVSFSKLFVDFLMFVINIGLLCFFSSILITNYLNGSLSNKSYWLMAKFFVSICFFYLFASFGIRLINSWIPSGKKKMIFLGIWILITLGYYLVGSLMTNNKYFYAFLRTNINIVIYIPFLNLILPYLYLSEIGNLEFIHSVPLILYAILLVQIPWIIYSKKLKVFLCA